MQKKVIRSTAWNSVAAQALLKCSTIRGHGSFKDHMTRILTYSSFCKFSNSIREKTQFCHLMSLKILRGFG